MHYANKKATMGIHETSEIKMAVNGNNFCHKKWKKLLTRLAKLLYSINVAYRMCAALAQSVERRLGKAEVGGSIPLGSFESP